MNQLQKNLQYLLGTHGTNPTALAAATGVTQPTIHRILTGESRDPRTQNLEKIASYFNVTAEQLRSSDIRLQPGDLVGQSGVKNTEVLPRIEDQLSSSQSLSPPTERVPERTRKRQEESAEAHKRFTEALLPNLRQYVERREKALGLRFSFDYCSEKVVANLLVLTSEDILLRGPLSASAKLWRLSTFRLASRETFPERKYYLFVILPLDGDPGAIPVYALSRAVIEARLHGIRVVLTSATNAGEWVTGVEQGLIRSFDEEGMEEDF